VLQQAVLRAAQARAESVTESAVLFDIEKVAEGVYGAVAHRRPRSTATRRSSRMRTIC